MDFGLYISIAYFDFSLYFDFEKYHRSSYFLRFFGYVKEKDTFIARKISCRCLIFTVTQMCSLKKMILWWKHIFMKWALKDHWIFISSGCTQNAITLNFKYTCCKGHIRIKHITLCFYIKLFYQLYVIHIITTCSNRYDT